MSGDTKLRILVTGAAGFVGTHLVELLATDPRAEITATDAGGQERLDELSRFDSVTTDLADLRNPEALGSLVTRQDVVIHLAAVRTQAAAQRPRLAHEVNVSATYDLISAARDAKVKRIVFGSTHTVYGSFQDPDRAPFAEDEPWACYGINTYAATKLAVEAYLEAFAGAGGPDYLALRLGTIYGPRCSAGSNGSLMTEVIRAIRQGETPTVPWASTARHALIHVHDIVEAIRRAAFSDATRMAVNVAGVPRTSTEIYGTLAKLAGGAPETILYKEDRTRHQLISQARLKEVLDFTPQVGFEDGLRTVVDWYDSVDGRV